MRMPRDLQQQARTVVFAGAPLPIACERVAVMSSVLPHTHDFLEMAVVVRGAATYVTQGSRRTIAPGDVVIVRPGGWHAFEDPCGFEVYNVYLGPELLQSELAWVLDHPRLARALIHGGESTVRLHRSARERVTRWLNQMLRAAESSAVGDCRASSTAILQLGLLTCVLSEVSSISVGEASRQTSISHEVKRVITMMAADLAHPWSVGELAVRVGLSESQLHRRFAGQIGFAPIQWLVRIRAEKAASLLAGTDATVASIGRSVGWADPNYASRRFRNVYQMTPSEYRARFAFRAPSSGAA